MWRNMNPHILLKGPKNGTNSLENNMAVPQKVTPRVTIWPTNSTTKHISKKNENKCPYKNMYSNVHSIVHCSQKVQTTQLSINLWTDTKCGTITQYCMSIKRNALIHVITRMNCENMPNEKGQSQKTTCYMISFIWSVQNRQI